MVLKIWDDANSSCFIFNIAEAELEKKHTTTFQPILHRILKCNLTNLCKVK